MAWSLTDKSSNISVAEKIATVLSNGVGGVRSQMSHANPPAGSTKRLAFVVSSSGDGVYAGIASDTTSLTDSSSKFPCIQLYNDYYYRSTIRGAASSQNGLGYYGLSNQRAMGVTALVAVTLTSGGWHNLEVLQYPDSRMGVKFRSGSAIASPVHIMGQGDAAGEMITLMVDADEIAANGYLLPPGFLAWGQNYRLLGNVTELDAPVGRTVRAYLRRNGQFVQQATSDPETGSFELLTPYNEEHTLVAWDDDDGAVYEPAAADRIMPGL